MTTVILGRSELGLAQCPFEGGEEVRNHLSVVPDMGAGAGTTSGVVATPFPTPEPTVRLPEHRRRFQDGQVGGHRLDHLRRQGRIVETVAETLGPEAQIVVVVPPMTRDLMDVGKTFRVPRLMRIGWRGDAVRILAEAQIRPGHMPGQSQRHRVRGAGGKPDRHEHRCAGRSAAFGHRRTFLAHAVSDVIPGHCQRIPPSAPKPGMIDLRVGLGDRSREGALLPGLVLSRSAPENESARGCLDGVGIASHGHEIPGVEREDSLDGRAGGIIEPVLERGDRQARVIGGPGLERTPTRDFDAQRDVRIRQTNGREREARSKRGLAKTRKSERGTRGPVAGAGGAEQLPGRHGAFEHARHVRRAFHTDGSECHRLVKDLRTMPQRHVRQSPCAFEADHAGAQAAERESDAVEPLARVLGIVFRSSPGRWIRLGRCRRRRRGARTTKRANGRRGELQKLAACQSVFRTGCLRHGLVLSLARHLDS